MSKIPRISEYYVEDGKFFLKSKLAKGIKLGLMVGFLLGGIAATDRGSAYISSAVSPNMVYATKDAKYVDFIQGQNKNVSKSEALKIVKSTLKWSSEFQIDERILFALMTVESRFDKYAISSAGALGLTQVMVQHHMNKIREAKKVLSTPEVFDIDTNIFLGAWVLKDCLKQYKNLKSPAFLCYNGSNANPNGYDKQILSIMEKV